MPHELTGAADRDVLEARFEQPQDLVAPEVGLEELRIRRESSSSGSLILREPEEVVLLAPFRRQRRCSGHLPSTSSFSGLNDLARRRSTSPS